MISKYSTHKTWAFVLERAFSCWYRRYRHRSQDLREDLKATSRAAFVPLEMMLLPSYLSNWRGQEGFSPCLCDAIFSAAPVPTSARPVQKELRGAVGYFKWLFCASLLSVSEWAKALQLGCMGGDLGWDCSSAGEPDQTQWKTGSQVCLCEIFFPRHMIYIHMLLGHPKEFPPVVISQPV